MGFDAVGERAIGAGVDGLGVAELIRQGARHIVGVGGLLPRVLYRYELDLHRLLDLADAGTRTHLDITEDELVERWDDLADLA